MRWPKGLDGLCYGGDWNPEQWPEPVWRHDLALMRQAGVNLVTVGVFAWARLEPEPGRFTFDWLDRILDAAYEAGIRVNLATPTASPPPWFSLRHPEALPVTAEGVRLTHGSRDTYCVAAPAYRAAAARVADALARRYASHPALAMWHVHNEYATDCYCDDVAAAFRRWLRDRHGGLSALNAAWGTAFWGQQYHHWDQVLPPRATRYLPNPHQLLDFRRFLSDELRAAFREQRDLLRAAAPDVPITMNAVFGDWVPVDHRDWANDMDLVSLDAYPEGEEAEEQTAFLGDLARHWAGGRSWLLMEQAPGALRHGGAWVRTVPGQMARLSLSHVARGSRGVMFFQWRASAAGAEQFHPAMVPHAGEHAPIFAEVRDLGAMLPRLAEADAGEVSAQVAIAWDAGSWWALRAPHLPSPDVEYLAALRRAHRWLWRSGVTADFADLGVDLSRYRLVLVPSHFLVDDRQAASVRRYVERGGHLVVWYFSGVADANGHVRLGGVPGAFRDVLGVRVQEWRPLPPGGTVALDDGTLATTWCELVELAGAEVVLRYAEGQLADRPAVTRNRYGAGSAWYVSARLADAAYDRVLAAVSAAAGVGPVVAGLPSGVEVVRRADGVHSWLFVLNHTDRAVRVPVTGWELLSDQSVSGVLMVEPDGVAVIRQENDGVDGRAHGRVPGD